MLQVICSAPSHKVLHQAPVFTLLSIPNTPHYYSIIWKLLQVAQLRVVLELWYVQGEEHSSLWCTCATDHSIRCTVPPASHTGVYWWGSPESKMLQQFVSQDEGLYSIEGTGEVKEHNSHSTTSFVQVRVCPVSSKFNWINCKKLELHRERGHRWGEK